MNDGHGFVPYSPLARGFLTGQFKTAADIAAGDYRRATPRCQGEAFDRNIALVGKIERVATDKGCTPAQLALARVVAQGDDIVSIPGTKRRKYLDDNAGAVNVTLSETDFARIDAIMPVGAAVGERYAALSMTTIDQ